MYLRYTLKDSPAMNDVQRLTQTAEILQDFVRCLKDCHDRPRLQYCEHVRSNVQDPKVVASGAKGAFAPPLFSRMYHRFTASYHRTLLWQSLDLEGLIKNNKAFSLLTKRLLL